MVTTTPKVFLNHSVSAHGWPPWWRAQTAFFPLFSEITSLANNGCTKLPKIPTMKFLVVPKITSLANNASNFFSKVLVFEVQVFEAWSQTMTLRT